MYCEKCKKEVNAVAGKCPVCGEVLTETAKSKKSVAKKWWFWVIIIAVIFLLGSSCFCGMGIMGDTQTTDENISAENDKTSAVNVDNDEAASASVTESKIEEETTAAQIEDDGFIHVGEVLDCDGLEIKYVSGEKWTGYNQYSAPKSGNIIVKLWFEVNNTANSDRYISLYDFNCYADGAAAEAYYFGEDDISLTLSKGRSGSGAVYFEVPADAELIEVEYEVNFWTDKKAVFLVETA